MRVVIVGAGLGGLVLAHALRDHADVVVLDRDAEAADTGGYRIALTPEAVAVVEQHVPASVVERIREVSDGPETFAQFTIADAQLRPIVVAPEPEGQDRMLCQRRALRLILADDLGERIRFASTVVAARSRADGASVALSDGTEIDADLVVAADGARSSVVEAVTERPTSDDAGLIGIAGSSPMTAGATFPRYLAQGPALALDHRGVGMFLSLASRRTARLDAAWAGLSPELRSAVGPPALVWGLIARREMVADILGAPPGTLIARAHELAAAWHPWMTEQIETSDPARTAAFSFRAARPHPPRFPWSPSRVTAIGDAVHAMPPTGGRAGSTAIRSAGALAEALIRESRIDDAVRSYQSRVDEWAVPAIRESLGPVRVIRALRAPLVQAVARPALAVAGVVGAARYRRSIHP
ncbi:NAD(P)/FAD-dependent oxidoreductase [Microbacterium invictum]|uniref:NAD(P)/FAD-dependent oxidoreductase n=1 Tax=Microbacterium invictum TaxID=515415 RepID=A0ABZ0VAP7_9MICO|nr:NAD(P)/FAD-dependent oxidoreductase [Microbacterium invictum]WQB69766.1 NAD(P)/FAD-dependent oxidoreductase [Microbacterium invictum]